MQYLSCCRAVLTSWGGSSSQPTSNTKSAVDTGGEPRPDGAAGASAAGGTMPSGWPSSSRRSMYSPADYDTEVCDVSSVVKCAFVY